MQIDISNKIVQLSNQTISFGKNKEPSFGKNEAAKVVAEAVKAVRIASPSDKIIELTANNIGQLSASVVKTISLDDIKAYLKDIDLSKITIKLLGNILR